MVKRTMNYIRLESCKQLTELISNALVVEAAENVNCQHCNIHHIGEVRVETDGAIKSKTLQALVRNILKYNSMENFGKNLNASKYGKEDLFRKDCRVNTQFYAPSFQQSKPENLKKDKRAYTGQVTPHVPSFNYPSQL